VGDPEVWGMRPSGVEEVPTLLSSLVAADRDHSPSGGRPSGVGGEGTERYRGGTDHTFGGGRHTQRYTSS
jgi:hypothetical protein